LGGRISVDSAPGDGTTFILRIPKSVLAVQTVSLDNALTTVSASSLETAAA
jgi:chemotaxis protein histidine kinase CheA